MPHALPAALLLAAAALAAARPQPATPHSTPAPAIPAAPGSGPIVPPGSIDPFTSRAAAAMLTNIIDQAVLVPESDFIKRLADAGTWLDAPELAAILPGAPRIYRVPVPSTPFYVADDAAGDDITVLIPRPDMQIIDAVLREPIRLEPITDPAVLPEHLPAELRESLAAALREPAAALAQEPPADDASETIRTSIHSAYRGDVRAGTIVFAPTDPAYSPGGVSIRFIADPDTARAAEAAASPTITRLPDGSIELSSGLIIRGQGTADKPYELSWDLLVSAERIYQPRNGMTRLPDWTTALHEQHVRLTGHLLSPLMMDDTDQILLMRNQWDGCCVGVPPTPYDAVEVVLSRPVSLVREQLNYGTLTGVLKVDPYLVNNWLVGLYIIDDAALSAAGAQNWGITPTVPN